MSLVALALSLPRTVGSGCHGWLAESVHFHNHLAWGGEGLEPKAPILLGLLSLRSMQGEVVLLAMAEPAFMECLLIQCCVGLLSP